MGLFSWKCPACTLEILYEGNTGEKNWDEEEEDSPLPRRLSKAVAINKDNQVFKGLYDGYGSIGDVEFYKLYGEPSLWHEDCWKLSGSPEKFILSADARNQGYSPFFTKDELEPYYSALPKCW